MVAAYSNVLGAADAATREADFTRALNHRQSQYY
jgi:hypothetical protein